MTCFQQFPDVFLDGMDDPEFDIRCQDFLDPLRLLEGKLLDVAGQQFAVVVGRVGDPPAAAMGVMGTALSALR